MYCKGQLEGFELKPSDIPTTPNIIYRNEGWVSLGDWLGSGNVSNRDKRASYRPFRSARKYVRALNIANRDIWQMMYRNGEIPTDIPLKPERAYENRGWKGCGDWFGTGYVPPGQRVYRSFRSSRSFSRKLGLTSRRAWEAYAKNGSRGKPKLPMDMPATPARIYKEKGWNGWPDWLGKSK